MPRVLRRDKIGAPKSLEGALRDVGEIPYRRTDDVKHRELSARIAGTPTRRCRARAKKTKEPFNRS
jgi:hypothetical protein